MFLSSNDYEEVINRPIRPMTQVVITEYNQKDIPTTDIAFDPNEIDLNLMKQSPNLEPLRDETYYATLSKGGYRVGDSNLRCIPDTVRKNNVMPISVNAKGDGEFHRLYTVTDRERKMRELSITIAPIYQEGITIVFRGYNSVPAYVERFPVTELGEVTTFVTGITTPCEMWEIGFISEVDDIRVSAYPPDNADIYDKKVLFDPSNIVSVNYQKITDLYTQDDLNYSFEVTAIDLDKKLDPANPKGVYDNYKELYRVLVSIGYEISDGRFEYPYRKVMYLAEKPSYNGNLVTCKFSLLPWIASVYNNNLIEPIYGEKGVGTRTEYVPEVLRNVYVTPPNYSRTVVPRTVRYKTGYTHEDYATTGYSYANTNKDIYKLVTNAMGMYYTENTSNDLYDINGYGVDDFNEQLRKYYAGEIIPVKHFDTVTDFQLEVLPKLKTLTINKYENNDSDNVIRSYPVLNLSKDLFVPDGSGKATAYVGLVDTEEITISSCKVYDMQGANLMWYTTVLETNSDTGITKPVIRIDVAADGIADNVVCKLDLYGVEQRKYRESFVINNEGEDMEVDNPYITTDKLVEIAKKTITAIANCRELYKLTVIQDFRLQLGDIITIDTPYEKSVPCIITGLNFTLPSVKGQLICRRLRNGLANT